VDLPSLTIWNILANFVNVSQTQRANLLRPEMLTAFLFIFPHSNKFKAPPQSALRPDYQQLLPLPSLNGGGKESKKTFDEVQQTQQPIGPFEGFRSMLDWMIYGNGLAGQSKLQVKK
jgi:hypothetical protein